MICKLNLVNCKHSCKELGALIGEVGFPVITDHTGVPKGTLK